MKFFYQITCLTITSGKDTFGQHFTFGMSCEDIGVIMLLVDYFLFYHTAIYRVIMLLVDYFLFYHTAIYHCEMSHI